MIINVKECFKVMTKKNFFKLFFLQNLAKFEILKIITFNQNLSLNLCEKAGYAKPYCTNALIA